MSYSFTTKPNTAATVIIPVKGSTVGATITVEFAESSTFRSLSLIKQATGQGSTVNVSLTDADVQLLTDSYYRVKAVKDGKTSYIQDGRVDYVEPTTTTPSVVSTARRRQVSNRAGFPAASRNVTNTGGTNTQVQQTQQFNLTEDVADLSFTYGNFFRSAANDVTLEGLTSVTVRMSIWDGATTYPVFWPNGSRDITLEPGATASTTPLVFKGRKGQRLYIVRRMTWATPPTHFPASSLPANTSNEVNEWGTALADRTTSYGAFFTRQAGNFAVFPPLAITGTAKAGPVVAILGDSIASDGSNDFNTDDPAYGWAQGGLDDAGIPWVNLGTASLQLSHILQSKASRAQLFSMLVPAGVTHLLVALSTNDWISGRTSAQLLADLAVLRDELAPLGVKVVSVTSLPKTNAANNASAETNTFAQRALYNAAVRQAGSMYDLAAVVESPTNANLWRTDVKTSTGISVVSGGTGYKKGDFIILPGRGAGGIDTVSGSSITALYAPALAYGGWVGTMPAEISPVRVISADANPPVGTGAKFTYTGVTSVNPTTDGTHPQPPITRLIRSDFAEKAASIFTV